MIQGLGACQTYREEKCFISAYDAATGKEVWRFNTVAQAGEPGGDTWGKLPNLFRAGARIVDHRQLRSGAEPHVTGERLRRSRGCRSAAACRRTTMRSTPVRRSRSTSIPASSPGISSTRPAKRSISTSSSSACSSTTGTRTCCSRSARTASCGSSIERPDEYLGHTETVFQNVWTSFDPKTGRPFYRPDILEQQEFGAWVQGCPSTEGGHNWPASSFHQATNQLIIPLSQSCIDIAAQKVELKEGGGSGGGAGRRFYEMPGTDGHIGKLGGVRRADHEGNVVLHAAGAVHDRGDLDGGRSGVRRRPRSPVPGLRRADRRHPVGNAALDLGAGFPGDVQRRRQAVCGGDDRETAAAVRERCRRRSLRNFARRRQATRSTCLRCRSSKEKRWT